MGVDRRKCGQLSVLLYSMSIRPGSYTLAKANCHDTGLQQGGAPVIHVRAALAVGKAIEEAAKAQAVRLLALLALRVLEVPKILLPQLHLLLHALQSHGPPHQPMPPRCPSTPALLLILFLQRGARRLGLKPFPPETNIPGTASRKY